MEYRIEDILAPALNMHITSPGADTNISDPTPPKYIYDALDHKLPQIRLLTLESAKNYHDPIHGTLRTEILSDDLRYEALSYVWGDDPEPHTSYVDGRILEVTPNLDEALRNIRFRSRRRILWIDAICINQTNVSEKNHQVYQMHTIFANAAEVLVWLGESDDDMTRTMAFFASEDKKPPDGGRFPEYGS